MAQVDPVQALQNENARKLALIQEFENQKWLTEQRAIELREEANRQFEQNRINAQWEIWRNQSDANEFLASSLAGLANSATSTISGLVSGTMTATQAMQNFANVILNEAIGSLVQMGMQHVKNAIVAQSTSAATTATQITAAEALAIAYQPAAMLASIATQGTAATIGAESYMTALGAMKAYTIAGARKNGGPVAAKVNYPSQGNDLIPKLTLQFSRIYVGDEFKKIINSITPFGWQKPISMVYEQYNALSMDKPTNRYSLYVTENGIRFNRTSVQVTASDDNPMILAKPHYESNPIYTLEEYRGLVYA